ncbi:enoyl-CoA hydratase-related protein [Pigmentiphaga soli]|uniref:enoyl-CoA hydratase-related protein n=1 Tax=Pigmentiphaga soli TaxID=1007095 RepID=UPI0031E72E7D
MATSTETVFVEWDGPVAIVTLNRPEKRNAMNSALTRAITETLERLRDDDACRVVVLTGAGTAFCAGMDLTEFFSEGEGIAAARDRAMRDAAAWRIHLLRHFPKPTIAMVNGACLGGGFSVVECCDLALASSEAKFALTEINFRHIPAGPVSKSMASILRPRDALFLAMTGRSFDSATAERIGLINRMVQHDALRAETLALAHELAGKDAAALRLTKESYRYALEMGWEASINFVTAKTFELLARQSADASRTTEVQAFREGRLKPGA